MKLIKTTLIIMLMFLLCCIESFAAASTIYSFDSSAQQQQFTTITSELRCLVCENQDLSQSTSPLAEDFRSKIAKMISQGYSYHDIIKYFITRYQNYLLYDPPLAKTSWLVWLSPFILLIFSLALLYTAVYFIRHREDKMASDEKEGIKRILTSMEKK